VERLALRDISRQRNNLDAFDRTGIEFSRSVFYHASVQNPLIRRCNPRELKMTSYPRANSDYRHSAVVAAGKTPIHDIGLFLQPMLASMSSSKNVVLASSPR
jgi:hypothetical protein